MNTIGRTGRDVFFFNKVFCIWISTLEEKSMVHNVKSVVIFTDKLVVAYKKNKI